MQRFEALMQYLSDRRRILWLFVLFAALFAVVFSLHDLPVAAIGYGALVCLPFAGIAAAIDFAQYIKKHKALQCLRGNTQCELWELPEACGLLEEDCWALLHEAAVSRQKLVFEADAHQAEMLDFYTLWVHQIKTPIAAMSVLLQEKDTPQNKQLMQELFKIERYAELVLGYLRLDSVSADLRLEKCSLEGIVHGAVKKYAPVFIQNKLGLTLRDLDVAVLTDEKWLGFVLEQLLANALKYTCEGEIRIYLKAPATLVIEDTGIGIAPEDLPRVFERGFTGFNGRMNQKSTGLGLYLCKKTLDKLGHPVCIASVFGTGTTVMLSFSSDQVKYD